MSLNKKGKIALCGECHYHQAVYPTGKCYVEPKVNDRHQSEIACRHFQPKASHSCDECKAKDQAGRHLEGRDSRAGQDG